MPIQKFKTFEEAEKALITYYPDEAYYKRVAQLWDFANKLNPISWPRGIFKFKTIEEANKHREEIELAHARKKQAEKTAL
ncbi:MAG: hypothetical protein JSV88_10745 [Candidatus Aminicenantes bacterium]|jgi:hypothetical protein|nr:MAG: hypothetical protein JSV88_10745 [Candidatus Aminicenantes bacterium]